MCTTRTLFTFISAARLAGLVAAWLKRQEPPHLQHYISMRHMCRHVFHYVVENNITYLCLTDEAEKRRIAFGFLDDIKERFLATYGSRAQTAIAYAMNSDFGPVLQERMVRSLPGSKCSACLPS